MPEAARAPEINLRLLAVLALSTPLWLAEGVAYYLVALGIERQTKFETFGVMIAGMLLLTSVSNLATSIPSSSGAFESFKFFAKETSVFLGMSSSATLAYAVVFHIMVLPPVIVTGLVYLAVQDISVSKLTHKRPAADERH